MFDFTFMFAVLNVFRVIDRYGYRLLMGLVGDSLLEVGFKDLVFYVKLFCVKFVLFYEECFINVKVRVKNFFILFLS